jgi:hypothetical protein
MPAPSSILSRPRHGILLASPKTHGSQLQAILRLRRRSVGKLAPRDECGDPGNHLLLDHALMSTEHLENIHIDRAFHIQA